MQRALRVAVLAAVVAFVVTMAVAMSAYPGGTWCQRAAVGHDFWRNFLCDLTHAEALNGAPNVAQGWARAAMLSLTLGLGPFWPLAAAPLGSVKLRRAVIALGLGAVALLVLVPLVPSDHYGKLHGLVVIVAGVPGLSALSIAALGTASNRSEGAVLRVAAGAAFVSTIADMVLYLRVYVGGGESCLVLPATQKVAAAAVLAWMVAAAMRGAATSK